jgi:hypothetical protein
MSNDPNRIDNVNKAIQNYVNYLKDNSQNSDEAIKIRLNGARGSSVSYSGPDGSFTVKVDAAGNEASANVHFTTGNFKATVTEDTCTAKGVSPVFHRHWGKFHDAFNS